MCKCFFKTLAFDFIHIRQASFSLLNELANGVSSEPVLHASVRSADVINVSILTVIAIL